MTARHALAILLLAPLALASTATTAAGAAGTTTADTTHARTLDDVIGRLRSRTESQVSEESRRFDSFYRDSVTAVYDSTVTTDGLARTLATHQSSGEDGPRLSGPVRTGWAFSLDDSELDYSKVDGLSAIPAAYGYLRALGVHARAGGRVGYAFGSERIRYDAGVALDAHDVELGWSYREMTDTFGWTDVHAHRLFALAGADELDYLEREGWRVHLFNDTWLPAALDLRATYRREDERARRVRDYFTFGDRSGLFESNPQILEGEVRAVTLEIGRSRLSHPRLHGTLSAELAGRGLGGDLSYERVRARVATERRLPWADELVVTLAGQMAAAPGGQVPLQVLANPTGRAGVRGYPHRTRVGTHGLLARMEYHVERDLFRLTRIPLLARAKLQLVPFVDVGAAWSPGGSELAAGGWPEGGDWLWGAGLGIRRAVGFGEILSHVRLDVAQRLDGREANPVFYLVLEGEPFE